jgi:hypothetical protein
MTDEYTNYDWDGVAGGVDDSAPSEHGPRGCLQLHDPDASIEKLTPDEVWIQLNCEQCGRKHLQFTLAADTEDA